MVLSAQYALWFRKGFVFVSVPAILMDSVDLLTFWVVWKVALAASFISWVQYCLWWGRASS